MFDSEAMDRLEEAFDKLVATGDDLDLATNTELRDLGCRLQRIADGVDGFQARILPRIDDTEAYADDGWSTLAV